MCERAKLFVVREIKRERERGSEGKNEWGLDCLLLLFTLIIGMLRRCTQRHTDIQTYSKKERDEGVQEESDTEEKE